MKFFIFLIFFLSIHIVKSQTHEASFGFNIASYVGDLNGLNETEANFMSDNLSFNNARLGISLDYRYSFKDYVSIGVNYNHTRIAGEDLNSVSAVKYDAAWYRRNRNLSFQNSVNQLYVDFRVEPLRFIEKWDDQNAWIVSPYASLGLGALYHNPTAILNNKSYELQPIGTEGQGLPGYGNKYGKLVVIIPMDFGVRFYEPNRKFAISAGLSYVFSYSDYLDDVSTNYPNYSLIQSSYDPQTAATIIALANRSTYGSDQFIAAAGEQRGDSQDNDNIISTQIKFSWFFAATTYGGKIGCFRFK